MKPSFSMLYKGYPRRIKRQALYESLGWSDIKDNESYKNTCAIRVSVALVAADVPVTGWLQIKAGPFKGKSVEPSQAKLSRWLAENWGQPEIFRGREEARRQIGIRTGVVSFWGLPGASQGHMDLVKPDGNGLHECATSCYFDSREVWFWPVL